MSNKIMVNGTAIEGMPKVVEVPVAGKTLKLTLVHIGEAEAPEHKWTWAPVNGNTELQAETIKVGNRVATTLKVKGKAVFTNLTAQSVFEVILAKFGQSTSTTDSIYKRSNPARKEAKAGGAAKVVVEVKEGAGW